MKVSIITVNYNGRNLLGNFLNSIAKLNYPKDEYETIVVDNGSSDNSIAYLNKHFPWVRVIKSNKNLGFGAGNNLGISHAKGDLVLLLNNDTLPDDNSLKYLLELYKSISKKIRVGAINCKMVFVDRYFCFRVKNAVLSKVITNSYKPINDEFQKMVHEDSRDYFEYIYIPCGVNPTSGKITLSLSKLRHNNFSIEFGNTIMQKRFAANKDCTLLRMAASEPTS